MSLLDIEKERSMSNNIRLLVNGCSFSRGPNSWPYYLDRVDLTNLSCAGAGNTYIHETTMSELAQRSYDFVAVMWTGISRVDIKVEDIDRFKNSKYTSWYQSQQNDWPEKTVVPVNDQDFVEKDWVFGCGHINREPALLETRLFESVYKHQSLNQFAKSLLIKIISLQNFLKQLEIPYLFMYYQDYQHELEKHKDLFALIDQNHVYNVNNISHITKSNQWYDTDGEHPGPLAHEFWASLINPFINKY